MKILIASHYTTIEGATDQLVRYLKKNKNIIFTLLLAPLYKSENLPHKTIYYCGECIKLNERYHLNSYITDLYLMLKHALFNKYDIIIGADPLYAFAGILIKIVKPKTIVIFYSLDYADKRFRNKILNNLYHFIDNIAVKYSDYIWCVSNRMIEIRKKQKYDKNKIILVPNGTWNNLNYVRKPNKKIELVFVGHLGEQFDLDIFIKSCKSKNLILHIIGGGPNKSYLMSLAKEYKNIIFYGKLKNEKVLKILTENRYIGIAPYNNKRPHVVFGGSIKIIEYLSCGLPVITSDIVELSKDINDNKLGVVYSASNIKYEIKKIDEWIKYIEDNYELISKNALEFAKQFYWPNIYSTAFKKLTPIFDK